MFEMSKSPDSSICTRLDISTNWVSNRSGIVASKQYQFFIAVCGLQLQLQVVSVSMGVSIRDNKEKQRKREREHGEDNVD